MTTTQLRPFLKWAGGKGQILSQLEALFPAEFNGYIEPFMGGGAVFFRLYSLGAFKGHVILSDVDGELVNAFRVVRSKRMLRRLLMALVDHSAHAGDEEYYYQVRSWDREPGFSRKRSPVQRAARMIFLNHTCFNGLYRLNRSGHFNVPYGKWPTPPRLFDEGNLWRCHEALQVAEIRLSDFRECTEWAQPGDFVYLDPPYVPLSRTANFTAYSGLPFTGSDQSEVRRVFSCLDLKGCSVMLSNSSSSIVHELYTHDGWETRAIPARRSINSQGARRGPVDELVVVNYALPRQGTGTHRELF